MSEFISKSSTETIQIGFTIGKELKKGDIICLEGDLGSGKTTLTKGIASALGIQEEVTSPTYTLISEYYGTLPLYHMDLYRIDSIEEFEMLGAEDLLYGDGISIIEWSERILEYLPEERKVIRIHILENGSRSITYQENLP